MIEKVIKTVDLYNMFGRSNKVLVAVSGGSDSVALLHILTNLREKYSLEVEAAHVNHCIRGESADRDEEFVKELCASLGVKLHTLRYDVPALAESGGMTLEQAGRKVRYDFFESVCGDGEIATAHNLNDRIETFLFNFTRGSALKGLCSIPPVRDNIIRPLIDCSKEEIIDYCNDNGIAFVTDETNADTVYARNRIRLNVLPELEIINPSFLKTALRCIGSLNADEAFLSESAFEVFNDSATSGGYSIEILNNSPEVLKKRAVSMILEKETDSDIDMNSIDSVCASLKEYAENGRGTRIQLPGGEFARTRAGILEFHFSENFVKCDSIRLEPGENRFGGYNIIVSYSSAVEKNSQNVSNSTSCFYGDYDKVIGGIYAGSRGPDDKIRIKFRGISKPLRKIQNEVHMPPEIRDSIPVIRDDEGVLCAYGCGIDERFTVTAETEKIIIIDITEL